MSSRKEKGGLDPPTPSSAITGRRLLNASEWCSLLLGRQIKILHSLKFDPGAKPSNHGLQINSCSVHLEDIKKEKPFFNSEVQLQARARTDQVSDIIGKADRKNVEQGSREQGKRLGHQGQASQSRWPWAEEGRAENQHPVL